MTKEERPEDNPEEPDDDWNPEEPTIIPIDGVLDLHTFSPREVRDLLDDYLTACLDAGNPRRAYYSRKRQRDSAGPCEIPSREKPLGPRLVRSAA